MSHLRHWGSRLYDALLGSRGIVAGLALIDCLIVGGVNFLTVLLLGRIAGPDDLGKFALVMSVYYLLLSVQEALITMPYTVFGVRLKRVRQLQYSGAVLHQSAAWSACVSVIAALTAVIILFTTKNVNLACIVGVFAIVFPFWMLREFGRRYLFANMQVAKVVIMSSVGGFLQLVMICLLAYSGKLSDATALTAMGIASGISGFGWLWFSRTCFQFNRRRWSYFTLKNWIFGRWVLASHATAVVAGNAMPWLVVIWLGPSGTGVYAACDAILRFANPIIVSLNNVLTPRLAIGFKKGGKAELNRIVWQTNGFLSLFLLVFCFLVAVGGKWIMHTSFGSDYSGYSAALVVLAIGQLIDLLSLASSRALMVLNLARVNLYAESFGLTVSLIAAVLLIPLYGILGAAIANLAGCLALTVATVGAYHVAVRDGGGVGLFAIASARSSPPSIGSVTE
jgi:O-antigen/teichoic acid export membrane protein